MNNDFEQAYKKLNDEQKTAVDSIEGPLLVIAGPGTGKTELLSVRAANILRLTDASPENILCLTFTNKAALNMKERLVGLIGSAANNIHVKTFHSFAADIINQYPDYFWNGARLSIIPDAIQLDIVQSIQKTLPLDSPLAMKFAGQFTGTKDINEALKLVKEAGLTPERLRTIIKANLDYIDKIEPILIEIIPERLSIKNLQVLQDSINALPKSKISDNLAPLKPLDEVIKSSLFNAINLDLDTGKTKNTGKWKAAWLQTIDGVKAMHHERKRNNWWLEVAEFYQKYRDTLHFRGFYDYSDMLVETIQQLEKQSDILSDIQERFLYVMIDEFQDTNTAQLRFAHLIADHYSNNGQPNLMAVGDDDQSIYKFNGAELSNMLNFRSFYKIENPVVLTKNYRSTQKILDFSSKIAQQAQLRIVNQNADISKDLVAASNRSSSSIESLVFNDKYSQYQYIADEIEKEFNPNKSFAILARNNDSLLEMAKFLNKSSVPISCEKQNNILENPSVLLIYYIMKAVRSLTNGDLDSLNSALSKMIAHPAWGLSQKELWSMALENRSRPNWIRLLESSKANTKKIATWLYWLNSKSRDTQLSLMLEYIIGLRASDSFTSPLKEYFTSGNNKIDTSYLETLSSIQTIRDLSYEFSFRRQATINDFVDFIDLQLLNNEVVGNSSSFSSSNSTVELLSVHKAKGLEFDNVYIIDAIENKWRPRAGGRKAPANLPLQPYGDDMDDYVRLMYVAVTRAKNNLTIASTTSADSNRESITTPIISSVTSSKKITLESTTNMQALETSIGWPELNSSDKKTVLKPVIDNYNLSVTGLINYLDITQGGPEYFMTRNLLRLPESKSSSMSYGTAMHTALEVAQILTNKKVFSLSTVIKSFEKALQDESMPANEYQRYLAKGKLKLSDLFDNNVLKLKKGSIPEQNIRDMRLHKAILSGKLDRIDIEEDRAIVVDYKTGTPLKSLETKDKNKAVKAWKNKLQLVYYALLLSQEPKYKNLNIDCQMIYLEAENPADIMLSYTPTKDEIESLQKLIEIVWTKIINLDFPDISSYSKDFAGIKKFQSDLLAGTI